jgi:3-ketosteroid 9alpha-monooxygenase subunit A
MYPRGWFVVAFAEELEPGQLSRLRYFGRELVLHRDAAGRACVRDGHCARGVPLGFGTLADGVLRCPRHPDCVDERVASWRVLERNRLIFVHFDAAGAAPTYDIPVLPECDDAAWQPWIHQTMRLATHSREIVENVADRAHFLPVHDTVNDSFETELTGHLAVQRARGHGGRHPDVRFTSEATYHGPGYQITRLVTNGLEALLVNAHTMIDAGKTLDLRFGVMLKSSERRFARHYVEDLQRGFGQDTDIWLHKVWRDRPVLCDGDGPIMALRRWYAQFYATSAGP